MYLNFTFVSLFLFVLGTSAKRPETGKTYLIRSSMDGGYLRPLSSGELCNKLSQIIAIYRTGDPSTFPEEYQWQLSDNVINEHVILHNKGLDSGYTINEITFDDYPPYCYLIYRDIDIVGDENANDYQIVSVANGKCLSHYGSEVGIMFWMECGASGPAQHWLFEEVFSKPNSTQQSI
jgi:hypothetical protein